MRSARLSPLPVLLLLAIAPALAACQTDSTGAPMAQASAPPEPPTRQDAAMQCWASVDKAHKDLSLDKRADIVTKCITDKMAPGQTPTAAAPKALPKLAPDRDRGSPAKPPKVKT